MKKNRRKLTLNRETIRNLDANHLYNVVGGAFTDQPDCDTQGPETGDVSGCDDTVGTGASLVGCGTVSGAVNCTGTGGTWHTN